MVIAIETENLSKCFGNFTAVNDLSLSIKKGEIYGFLGLNGAGKTTTIRMLAGLIKPSGGKVRICGESIHPGGRGPWHSTGFLVEIPYAYPELTVRENIEIVRRMRSLPNKQCVNEIMENLKLSRYADRKAGKLSLGNAQRLGLARALIHNPEVLVLDEPANGLDPSGIVETRELLRDLSRNRGVTVFVSSHILDEIARLADKIGIIHEGTLVRELDIAELHSMQGKRLTVSTRDNQAAVKALATKGYAAAATKDGTLELHDPAALDEPEKVASILVENRIPPQQLYFKEDSLETLFLRIIGKQP
ncbi:MAG: ATP-binding cassette domain-containing protein [Chitinivibrionales bacterium]|nr:ATP-binding cassette domain-containing protein [Chitinivibrionales bacterium]